MSRCHCQCILAALVCLLVTAAPAMAQDPPSDDDFFGGDDDTPAKPAPTDDDPFPKRPDFESKLDAQNDKLQLGGSLWIRSQAVFVDSPDAEDQRLSFPSLVELYLDSRPTDRIRGFIKGRLTWNPSVGADATPSPFGDIFGFSESNLSVALDQLWLKFDIARSVYFTIGQQNVRWGASRIWNPVDVVNSSFRVPLALFDARTGVPMLKVHVPVESLGWNFYLLGMLREVDSFDDAGVAARAEFVFSTVELGLVGTYRKDSDPKVGLDISAGIFDVDLTSEVGIRLDDGDPRVQASAGLEYGIRYSDEDTLYLGGEYFYNMDGGTTSDAIAGIFEGNIPQPFYIGEHYASLFVSLPQPGRLDDSYVTVSAIGNLTDKSFLARLDWSETVLTRMTVQAYIAGHFGDFGELRLGEKVFAGIPTQLIEAGLNLRIDL